MDGEAAVVTFLTPCICDTDVITAAAREVKEFIQQQSPQRIVFDFEHVKFFSSQVLGIIIESWTYLQERSGRVMISSINPQLHRVFHITNLDRILEFFPNKQDALNSPYI